MTLYPNAIDGYSSLPILIDLVNAVRADDVNRLRNTIVAIEKELGVNPSGTYGTIKERLDSMTIDGYGSGGGSGGSGGVSATSLTLATNSSNYSSVPFVIGGISLDGSIYTSIDFVSIGSVTDGYTTGTISLYNLTDTETVTEHTYTSTNPSKSNSSVTLPSGDKIYEVRISLTDGADESDQVSCIWAGLEVS